MELLYSPASPYSAKTRMAARYLELKVTSVKVDTAAPPTTLTAANPLGKIPTLLLNDGRNIYDSVAIMHFLDRKSGGKLYPKKHEKRTDAEVLEALCDGILDCLLAIVYERRSRPAEIVHQPWIEKHWNKVVRSLEYLDANMPKTTRKLHGGHFALAALIGYLELRFAGEWEKGHKKLTSWPKKFAAYFPEYYEMKSSA